MSVSFPRARRPDALATGVPPVGRTYQVRMTRRRIAVAGFLCVIVAIAAMAYAYFFVPHRDVEGMEFSPDLIAHRAFKYKKWLWCHVSDRETLEFQTPLERHIVEQGWVSKEDTANPRWFLIKVYGDGGYHDFRDGRMKQVCHAFGCFAADSQAWVVWSQENPARAEELWAKVYEALRDERFGDAVELTWMVPDRPSPSLRMAPMHQFPPD